MLFCLTTEITFMIQNKPAVDSWVLSPILHWCKHSCCKTPYFLNRYIYICIYMEFLCWYRSRSSTHHYKHPQALFTHSCVYREHFSHLSSVCKIITRFFNFLSWIKFGIPDLMLTDFLFPSTPFLVKLSVNLSLMWRKGIVHDFHHEDVFYLT